MARTINFEFRKGSGAPVEIMFGEVTLTPTLMHSVGTSAVIPAPTKADLVDGKASMPNVAPTPAPVAGQVEWAYKVVVKDRHGKHYEWLVGVPDALPAINFVALPRYYETKPPLYGEGPPGPAGTAATFAVGTVTSGPTPAITNSGTSTNAVLNFTLAKGDKGDKGDPGFTTLVTPSEDGLMRKEDKAKLDTTADATTPGSIVKRSSTGAITTGTPTSTVHATPKSYVDALGIGVTLPTAGAAHDLNTYTTPGIYLQPRNDGATGGTNYPVGMAGKLDVKAMGSIVFQLYHSYRNDNNLYYRSLSGTWSAWRKAADESVVSAAVAELAFLNGMVLTREELVQSVTLGAMGGTDITVNGSIPIWIAPFNCQVSSLTLAFQNYSMVASPTIYHEFALRKTVADKTSIFITSKRTSVEAVSTMTPWRFTGSTWNTTNKVLAEGDILTLNYIFNSSPGPIPGPIVATFRVEPL